MSEANQQEKLGQLLEVSYHERKNWQKGTEASIVWVRDTHVGVEGNREDSDYKKWQALPENNSVKLT